MKGAEKVKGLQDLKKSETLSVAKLIRLIGGVFQLVYMSAKDIGKLEIIFR